MPIRVKTKKKLKIKGVVLLSGGIDSVTTLYAAKEKGCSLTALVFDYGQRHKKELSCARHIAKLNQIPCFTQKIDLSWAKSSLIDRAIKVARNRKLTQKNIPNTYVAGRNIIFLSFAFSLAERIGAKCIFIGAHIQDYSGYPDCRPEFLYGFQEAVGKGLSSSQIKIVAPLLDMKKSEIIRLGVKLKVPFDLTWSCYSGQAVPCGTCDSCRYRLAGFKELCLPDPAMSKTR